MVHIPRARLTAIKKSAACEDRLLLLCDGKSHLRHAPPAKKGHKQEVKKQCNRMAKKMKKQGRDDHKKQLRIQTPYISFFIIYILWKKGGLHT